MAFHRNTDITLGDFSECIDTTIEWRTPCIPATLAFYILKMDGLLGTVFYIFPHRFYPHLVVVVGFECS
jgi:hypothetical protein